MQDGAAGAEGSQRGPMARVRTNAPAVRFGYPPLSTRADTFARTRPTSACILASSESYTKCIGRSWRDCLPAGVRTGACFCFAPLAHPTHTCPTLSRRFKRFASVPAQL
jgi:hypothetical protein